MSTNSHSEKEPSREKSFGRKAAETAALGAIGTVAGAVVLGALGTLVGGPAGTVVGAKLGALLGGGGGSGASIGTMS